MKYVGLVLMLVAMYWSWNFIKGGDAKISQATQIGIQEDLQQVIAEAIQKTLPNARNLVFKKMWTQTLRNQAVKASFIYAYDMFDEKVGDTNVEIRGHAILTQAGRNPEGLPTWDFQLFIEDNEVEFKESLEIRINQ